MVVADSRRGAPPSTGTCFGYDVHTGVRLSFLRQASGDASAVPLDVLEADEPAGDRPPLLAEWTPRPGNELHARLHLDGNYFRFWTDREGWFLIDVAAPSIAVPPSADPVRREVRLWGLPAALCYIARGDLPLHAAAVEVDGRALVFAAPGRFGKTTLAAAFLRAGHRVLAEDLTCCRLSPTPEVLPGPAVLRVRRDMYERLELGGTVAVAEEPERVFLALEEPRRGSGAPVRLSGIVLLREHQEGPRLEPLSAQAALPDLWSLSLNLPTDEDRARCFTGIATLAMGVKLWNLYRPLQFELLPSVVELLVSQCATW